ncbi:hypothetical protein VHEMI08245 [[Torrubiella] hemipterigena]|uniref:ATP-grasp domain-containing protein n=1 Tax=[Torrubiella] hemipterigena TaxID=1531966 RepID=A0A0A1TCT9_9HYPO|nr:hypothetical protein VHEMI08245 [[Torrubiella] hemipterigena]
MVFIDGQPATADTEEFKCDNLLVNIPDVGEPLSVSVSWRLLNEYSTYDPQPYFLSIDLIIKLNASDRGLLTVESIQQVGRTPIGALIQTLYTKGTLQFTELPVKVVLATRSGHLCRNDLLRSRMVHAEHVEDVVEFVIPSNGIQKAILPRGETSLPDLMAASPGAIVGKPSLDSHKDTFRALNQILHDRLSFNWLIPTKPVAKTVAVVGGRPMFDTKNMSWGSRGPFEAAQALGMSLIVLDYAGHFMDGEAYADLRDDFIAVDMTIDAGLPTRLAAAVHKCDIDAIVTFSDEYVIATAQTAALLGLATEPVDAVLRAHYKDKTRNVLKNASIPTLRLNNAAEGTESAVVQKIRCLNFPLIVKPCRGAASRGVKKVQDEISLQEALQSMEKSGLAKHGILIEPYVDGPEVDANFVMLDGQVLFVELTDDFPCNADAAEATVADDFRETIMLCPTALEYEEQEAIKISLGESLVSMGFRSGVFHVEARVQNSSKTYRKHGRVLDLQDTGEIPKQPVSIFLIEVNVRPPGLDCAFATLYTCGVDLCALHLLRAVEDFTRYQAIAQPFQCHSQYWCGNCQIPVGEDEIIVPEDFCQEILKRVPDIAPFVSRAEMFKHPGTVVSPVHGVEFLAYFLVFSRESRKQVLEWYERLLEVARYILGNQK